MNVFAKFDEIPSMILQDIKETKRYGHTVGRSLVWTGNVKTVYSPTNTVCGWYKNSFRNIIRMSNSFDPDPGSKLLAKVISKRHW